MDTRVATLKEAAVSSLDSSLDPVSNGLLKPTKEDPKPYRSSFFRQWLSIRQEWSASKHMTFLKGKKKKKNQATAAITLPWLLLLGRVLRKSSGAREKRKENRLLIKLSNFGVTAGRFISNRAVGAGQFLNRLREGLQSKHHQNITTTLHMWSSV